MVNAEIQRAGEEGGEYPVQTCCVNRAINIIVGGLNATPNFANFCLRYLEQVMWFCLCVCVCMRARVPAFVYVKYEVIQFFCFSLQ